MEVSDCSLFGGIIPAFAQRAWRNPQQIRIKTASVLVRGPVKYETGADLVVTSGWDSTTDRVFWARRCPVRDVTCASQAVQRTTAQVDLTVAQQLCPQLPPILLYNCQCVLWRRKWGEHIMQRLPDKWNTATYVKQPSENISNTLQYGISIPQSIILKLPSYRSVLVKALCY